MIPVQMSDETRNIGKPRNWDEKVDGPCHSLSVTDMYFGDKPYMVSAWQPTAEELETLSQGGFLYLGISGTKTTQHPVIFLEIASS